MGVARTRQVGSGWNPLTTLPTLARPEPDAPRRDTRCIECFFDYDNEPDLDEAYCPWCGARNPECVAWVVWAELQAAEEAFAGGGAGPERPS
jgi:hypothetical protein